MLFSWAFLTLLRSCQSWDHYQSEGVSLIRNAGGRGNRAWDVFPLREGIWTHSQPDSKPCGSPKLLERTTQCPTKKQLAKRKPPGKAIYFWKKKKKRGGRMHQIPNWASKQKHTWPKRPLSFISKVSGSLGAARGLRLNLTVCSWLAYLKSIVTKNRGNTQN